MLHREYVKELAREGDERRRAYEQKKKAEREEKKRKAAEEQELVKRLEEGVARAMEKRFEKLFK